MFTIGTKKVLNLPEQVEKNRKDIEDLQGLPEQAEKAVKAAEEAAEKLEEAKDDIADAKAIANAAIALSTKNAETMIKQGEDITVSKIDAEGDVTAGADLEVDGTLTVNSRDSIVMKDASDDSLALKSELTSDYNALDAKIEANSALIDTKQDKGDYALKSDLLTVDPALSSTSENPVQNKAVYTAVNLLNQDVSRLDEDKQDKGDYALKSDLPTKTSQLINDSGYLISSDVAPSLSVSKNTTANTTSLTATVAGSSSSVETSDLRVAYAEEANEAYTSQYATALDDGTNNYNASQIKSAFDSKQDKVEAKGSSTQPVYISGSGTFAASSTYAGGTAVTLNGTSYSGKSSSFYAPTTAPTKSGKAQVITSAESTSQPPIWSDIDDLSVANATSASYATHLGTSADNYSYDTLNTALAGKQPAGDYALKSDIPAAVTVDSALSSTSENPVQNKVINTALSNKQDKGDYALKSDIPAGVTVDVGLSSTSENPVQNKAIYTAVNLLNQDVSRLDEDKQDKLTAGSNITISDNTISATVPASVTQADYDVSNDALQGIVIGDKTYKLLPFATSIDGTINIGTDNDLYSDYNNIVIGHDNKSTGSAGQSQIMIGRNITGPSSNTKGYYAISLCNNGTNRPAGAVGDHAIAIGSPYAYAGSEGAVALGSGANVAMSAKSGIALGFFANAKAVNGIAIGTDTCACISNTLSIDPEDKSGAGRTLMLREPSNLFFRNAINSSTITELSGYTDGKTLQDYLDAKQDKGDYALTSAVPTETSQLTNDSGYLISSDVVPVLSASTDTTTNTTSLTVTVAGGSSSVKTNSLRVAYADESDDAYRSQYTDNLSDDNYNYNATDIHTALAGKQPAGDYATETELAAKQDKLVSGTSIKTINGSSVLGEGNLVITGNVSVITKDIAYTQANVDNGTLWNLLANKYVISVKYGTDIGGTDENYYNCLYNVNYNSDDSSYSCSINYLSDSGTVQVLARGDEIRLYITYIDVA